MWGIIALSIYTLQIFSILPKWFASLLLIDVNLVTERYPIPYGQETYVFLLCFYILFTYHLVVKLWSKINFKFSFEWIITRFAALGSKQSVSQRLNVDAIMNKMDKTPNKRRLGANAILGVSMAVCKAGAFEKKIPLYEHISNFTKSLLLKIHPSEFSFFNEKLKHMSQYKNFLVRIWNKD